ncbi:hypothetical protein ACJZ2D_003778 [Fusarium nematophilum]
MGINSTRLDALSREQQSSTEKPFILSSTTSSAQDSYRQQGITTIAPSSRPETMASPRLSSLDWLVIWPLLIASLFGPSTLASPVPPTPAGKSLHDQYWVHYPQMRYSWIPLHLDNIRGGVRKQRNFTEPDAVNPIPKLSVSIVQTSTERPKIMVKVTNGNAVPITLAPYATPLDDQAEELGLFHTKPKNAECWWEPKPHWLDDMVWRSMSRLTRRFGPTEWVCTNITPARLLQPYHVPPSPEQLISLGPGQSRENQIEMKTDGIGNGSLLTMKALWVGVWAKEKEQVTEELKAGKAWKGEEWIGSFESNTLVLKLDE